MKRRNGVCAASNDEAKTLLGDDYPRTSQSNKAFRRADGGRPVSSANPSRAPAMETTQTKTRQAQGRRRMPTRFGESGAAIAQTRHRPCEEAPPQPLTI